MLPDLDPPFVPVDRQMIAFHGHEGVERIRDLDAVLIQDRSAHCVEDVNLFPVDAGVAKIAVFVGGGFIQCREPRIGADVEEEVAFGCVSAATAADATIRSVPAVVDKGTAGVHLARIGTDVPVQEVEVVRRLVHEQIAAVGHECVPAPEVISSVLHIEIPMEVDRGDGANGTTRNEFLDLSSGRRTSIIERDVDPASGSLLRVEDAPAVSRRDRHRLFGDDIGASLESGDDDIGMRVVPATYDDRVGLRLREHRPDVGEHRHVQTERRPGN